MPNIGGVFVPDNLMPRIEAAAPQARPGLGTILGAAAQGAWGSVRYGLPYQAEVLSGTASGDDRAYYEQGLQQAAAAAAKAAPASLDDATSGRVGIGRFVGENLAASLPYMVGGLVGGIGGGLVGGPGGAVLGAIAGGTPQFSGSNVARAVETEGTLTDAAAQRSAVVAPFQSAADAAIARFLPGAGKVLGDMASTQAGGFLRRTATAMAKAGGTEAVTEAAQQVGERYAAGLNLGDADAAGEYVNAAVTALAVGGVMGAGGGFRRTPAVAKPAAEVTEADIDSHIESVLALPAPADFIGRPDGTTQTNPNGRGQLYLPSPDQFAQPDVYTDAAGNSALAPEPAAAEALMRARNAPVPTNELDLGQFETTDEMLARLTTPPAIDAPNVLAQPAVPLPVGSTSAAAITGTPVGQTPQVQIPPVARPFQDVDVVDLNKARKAKNADPAIVAQIDAELFARNASDPFAGVPMNQDIAKLRTASVDEQVAGVRQLLENGDSRTGTMRLAERLGIDVNAPGQAAPELSLDTVMTPEVAPAVAPVAPVAPAPVATVAPAAAAPAVATDTEAAIFQALAADKVARRPGDASNTEQEAKRLGLITNDDSMDVTPKGRQVFLRTPEAPAAIALAAEQNGYAGADQSQFERGVQAQLSGAEAPQFANVNEQAAFTAGQVWAEDFVANGETLTADQTRAVQARQVARETIDGTAVAPGERRTLSPEQVQQRAAANLVASSDLSGVSEGDVATLLRAARTGDPRTVGEMIQHVQRGGTLFSQPETGEVQLTTQTDGRGQPVFREMNTPDRGPGRAANRTESASAVNAKRTALRDEIEAAFQSSDITPIQRLKLVNRLRGNDFSGVIARLPGGPLANEMNASRRDFLAGVAAAAVTAGVDTAQAKVAPLTRSAPPAQLAAYARQGNIAAVLNHLATQGSNPEYRKIARKLINGGGWDAVTLAVGEDQGSLYGTTRLNDDGTTAILLNGEHGLEQETILHELIHAFVQQRWAGLSVYIPSNLEMLNDNTDRGNSVLRDFRQIWESTGAKLKELGVTETEPWAANFYSNPDEALSWMMTNKQAQQFLKGFTPEGDPIADGQPQTSVWGKFVDWVRGILGLPPQPAARTALDNLLDAGYSILDAGKDVRTGDFAKTFASALATQNSELRMDRDVSTRTAEGANEAVKRVMETMSAAADRIAPQDLKVKSRRIGLGILSHNQIDRAYGFTEAHSQAHRERVAIDSRFKQMFEGVYQRYEALMKAQPQVAENVSRVMSTATELGFDPAKTWDEHTWLTDPTEKARLKPAYDKMMSQLVRTLKAGDKAGWETFNEFRNLNEAQNFARMAVAMHAHVAGDPELAMGVSNSTVNPADAFMEQAQNVTTPEQIRAYWDRELTNQTNAAADYIREKMGTAAATGTTNDQSAARQHVTAIQERINSTLEARRAMQNAPYFHLGRFGENFGSAVIRTVDGVVDPKAQAEVARVLEEAGFTGIQISSDNTKPKIAMRFEKVDQALEFRRIAQELEKRGLIERGTSQGGPRNSSNDYGTASELPAFVRNYIDNLDTHPRFAEDAGMTDKDRASLNALKEQMKQAAIDTYIESQPDNSISKVLTKRYTVAGYNPDMVRSFAHRWRVGSTNIANVASAPKFNKFFTDMKAAYNEALSADSEQDPYVIQDVTNELKARDAQNPVNELADVFDKLRGFTHSYFLGFSPAYGLINMTQLGVTALPEMAKKHGYVKSFHAMRRATPQVLSIIKAVGAEAVKLGWKNAGDIAITEDVLRKAGLDDSTRQFIQSMMATGTIDIGSMARSLAQVADNRGVGSKTETYLRLSSAMGLYTETASRLLTALSARDLHGSFDKSAQDYAAKTVSESMFDYQSWNTARQLGKKGFLGPVTPIVTQFMSYQAQLTEKLYSEAVDAFSRARPGESAEAVKERRAGARRFLAGHLTAVTALAGTLGMPFAAAFAFAIEKMVDTFGDDDEPYDATASWRGFLADMFGKDVAEVLARGAPRAAGFDISARAGEANLLPGSEMLFDKRSWKEAIANTAGRSVGAAPSMLISILDGGSQFANGDVLGGMKSMLPVAFKGPTEAYRMSTDGYIDTKGNKLPMTPTSSAILWQLMGFSPAAKAEYGEARGDQAARRGEVTRRAGMLRNGIVRAITQGDNDKAKELIQSAMEFDQDNPAFAVIPSIASSIQRRQNAAVQSGVLGTPTGVTMNDIAGQQLTSYANF